MSLPSVHAPPAKTHFCYGTLMPGGVVYAGLMLPINDLAKAIEESIEKHKREQAFIREQKAEALKDWPPTACDRRSWERGY